MQHWENNNIHANRPKNRFGGSTRWRKFASKVCEKSILIWLWTLAGKPPEPLGNIKVSSRPVYRKIKSGALDMGDSTCK